MKDVDIKFSADEVLEVAEEAPKKVRFYGKMPLIGEVSYFVFLLTILLVPLFVLPSSWGFQLEFTKKFLFSGGVLLSLALWLITRLEDGNIIFPGGNIFWASLSVVVSFFISSLLSSSMGLSFTGLGYESDTFISIIILFFGMFLSSTFFESKKRFSQFFLGLIISSMIMGLVELVQLFSPAKLLAGGALANLIGKWNDLGIFFGLSLLLSLIGLESSFFNGSRLRSFFWPLLVASILLMAIVNYDLIWAIAGLFALVVFIYSLTHSGMFSLSKNEEEDAEVDVSNSRSVKNVILRPSFIVVVISIIFFFGTNTVGSVLGKYGIFQLEVRPSWQSTVEVAKASMHKNLFFGSGPNTFSTEWAASKPDAVNSTAFWNTDFNVGFGRVPSLAVTLGLLGLITSGLFLASLVYYGLRAFLASFDDISNNFMVLVSFVASLYLWSFSIFYSTDTALLSLTFVFTGIFLASLARGGVIKNYEFSFFGNPKLSFISVLVIVTLIISVISGGYLLSRKFAALYNFQHGLYSFNNVGNLEQAEASIKNAISLDEQDIYYRSLAELYLVRLRGVLNDQASLPKEGLLNQLQAVLSLAAGNAKKATEINGANYLNWMTLGQIGETVVPLKDVVAGSYDLAFSSYSKALSLNPKNPNIYFSLAKLQAAKGDIPKAREYTNQALERKANFTAALFFLSQIEASQGNLSGAIKRAEQAAVFSPDEVGILLQIGFLKYMSKDYSGAVTALKAATNIQSNYSNAKYFLGLSYSKLGQVSNAIKEFEGIKVLNPDSTEIRSILKNLRGGRGALENIVPPRNEPNEPEKRSKLPVNER